MEDLKKRIVDISNQHKQKEVKLLGTQDRLKSRIDLLEQRNAELVQEVKLLEQSRASFLEEKTELQVTFFVFNNCNIFNRVSYHHYYQNGS